MIFAKILKNFEITKRNFAWFGFSKSLILLFIEIANRFLKSEKLIKYKHVTVENYLLGKYSRLIKKENGGRNTLLPNERLPIWICWWQGETEMPELVKLCFSSLKKHSNGHEVILICEGNYENYVDIPTHIKEKFLSGVITITHFSDILRACLLNKYGGLWIDSTVFVTSNLDGKIFHTNFYSIKLKPRYTKSVTNLKWAGFFLYSVPNSLLFSNLERLFFEYWKNEFFLIDYLLIDYFIDIIKKEVSSVNILIEEVPENNPELYKLYEILDLKYNEVMFKDIQKQTQAFKLSYKDLNKLKKQTILGEKTMYSHLKELI